MGERSLCSQAEKYASCLLEDTIHDPALGTLFNQVSLVDADSNCPQNSRFSSPLQSSQDDS